MDYTNTINIDPDQMFVLYDWLLLPAVMFVFLVVVLIATLDS